MQLRWRSYFLAERRTMMQQYADMLDGLAKGAKIVPFQGKRTARGSGPQLGLARRSSSR